MVKRRRCLTTGIFFFIADNQQQIANIADVNYRYEGASSLEPNVSEKVKKADQYSYDPNGNLLCVNTGTVIADNKLRATNSRKLLWDEDNHLLAVSDNGFVSNYWYDASGERTVKESFDNEGVRVNGVQSAGRTGTSNFTVYVNPYTVINNGGQMSKHIYMGGQRILSKLCDAGSMADPTKDTTACANNFAAKYTGLTTGVKQRFDSLGVGYSGIDHAGVGYYKAAAETTPPSLYYYHSDHLGSASLITDGAGLLNQHLAYIPNGEVFVNQRVTSFDSRFKFTGKEMDEETGLYYFSQRYLNPKDVEFISADQLKEKKPWVSSYVYCLDNPIRYVDPDGRKEYKAYANGVVKCIDNESKNHILYYYDKKQNHYRAIHYENDDICEQLAAKPNEVFQGGYLNKATGDKKSLNKLMETFWALANNTNVEWQLSKYKTNGKVDYVLSTLQHPNWSASSSDLGYEKNTTKWVLHSHENEAPDKNNELDRMGYYKINNGQIFSRGGDSSIKTTDYFSNIKYLYTAFYTISGNLWEITPNGINPQIKARITDFHQLLNIFK